VNILEIKKYPEDVLLHSCKKIDEITPKERELFYNMLYTMRHFEGVGLAAPQIGLPIRLIVAEAEGEIIKLANPEIIKTEGKAKMVEGCLSIPDVGVEVKRASRITVRGLNDVSEEVEIVVEGFPARVLQHEIDHINGKLIVDYMNFWKKRRFKNIKKK